MPDTAAEPESEQLRIRIHGHPAAPTLVYLPGLHGDWTLISRFRSALGDRVRFVEFTYPRTLTWSLDDYAAHVEAMLADHDIRDAWLLGESFSSQVVWPIVAREQFRPRAIVLAGGFVQHPIRRGVRLAERIAGEIPLRLLTRILFGYARLARLRYRNSPETMASIEEFIARRTELDRQAAVHRLRLIAQSDFCSVARRTRVPIHAITGFLDPVVPWFFVRRWLRRHCPALRDYRIVFRADHNVLGSAADTSARQILQWMSDGK